MVRTSLLLLLLLCAAPVWASDELALLRADAEHGDPWAQLNLGAAYDNGIGVVPDAAQAQFNLGHSYATGSGVAQNYKEAVRWLELAAQQGLAEAQHLLVVCYQEGLGVKVDRREAQRWLSQAAAQHYQAAIDYAQRHHLDSGE